MSDAYSPVRTTNQQQPNRSWGTKKRRRFIIVNVIGVIVLIATALILYYVLSKVPLQNSEPPDPERALPPSPSLLRNFSRGAVCSDGIPCSIIGRDILAKGGSAVDAAIAALFCVGLVACQSMGLGGGFFMVVYERKSKTAQVLNARETAPKASSEDLYKGSPTASKEGPLAIAVPGELRGYWAAHQRYGKLPWRDLIYPTVELCENGYNMSRHQHNSLKFRPNLIYKDPLLREIFVNSTTGEFHKIGTNIFMPKFCTTLRTIAEEGGDSLYNGTLAKMLLEDLRSLGSIITSDDLENYQAVWTDPVKTEMAGGLKVFGVPPPGGGLILAYILNILDGFKFTAQSLDTTNSTIQTYHKIIEAFKFGYAKRSLIGDLGNSDLLEMVSNLTSREYAKQVRENISDDYTSQDPSHYDAVSFQTSDHGTAHLSVISPEGDAVSVTSSINLYFGSGHVSPQTGIILNSGIDDFAFSTHNNYFQLPFSKANQLKPGKRALSSMSPTIITDEQDDVRMVVGAAGGTKITTSVALIIMNHLWFGQDLKTSIDASRFHHQLLPMQVSYEYGIIKEVLQGLEKKGHKLVRYRDRGSIICALAKLNERIYGNADFRKGGDVFGF